MTREEAVAIIRKEYSCVGRDCDIERSCGKCDLVMPSKEPILEAYKMAIKALEQEPRWIPVSERLPEDFQRVLVTIVNYKGDKVVRLAEYYGRKRIFQIKENHEQWEVGEKGLLAWMPLPESYKVESEG